MMRVSINGVGIITPRASGGPGDLACVLREAPTATPTTVERIPLPAGMKAQDARRMARFTRLALAAADHCFDDAGARGRDAGLYIGLTHGTTSLLKEFLDFLYDYGPDMASPNAFSNGVTNAPLGAVSKQLGLTKGGFTLVGFENAGLETLAAAACALGRGDADLCCAGATEEYSPLVEEAYATCGLYSGAGVPYLPSGPAAGQGSGVSEGSVFFALSAGGQGRGTGCRYEPLDGIGNAPGDVDAVISGAGGGPQDPFELDALRQLGERFTAPPVLLFPKLWFGETFAVASMISVALACGMLLDGPPPFISPLHDSLRPFYRPSPGSGSPLASVLVIAAGRTGEVSAGLVTRAGS